AVETSPVQCGWPSCAAVSVTASARSASSTRAPRSCRALASAAPIPDAAPVTTAVRPSISIVLFLSGAPRCVRNAADLSLNLYSSSSISASTYRCRAPRAPVHVVIRRSFMTTKSRTSILELLTPWAEKDPESVAAATPPGPDRVTLSKVRLLGEIGAARDRYLTADVHPGDRIVLIAPSCPEFLIEFFGAHAAGLVVVAVNPLST